MVKVVTFGQIPTKRKSVCSHQNLSNEHLTHYVLEERAVQTSGNNKIQLPKQSFVMAGKNIMLSRCTITSLMQLCLLILLSIVGGYAEYVTSDQQRQSYLIRKNFRVCDEEKLCVPSSEYCDTKLGSIEMERQRCGLLSQKSRNLKSFCCPMEQVTPMWINWRLDLNDEESSSVKVLEEISKPIIKPSQEELQNPTTNQSQEEVLNPTIDSLQEELQNSTTNQLQEEALKPTINPLNEETVEQIYYTEEALKPTINPLKEETVEQIYYTEEALKPTINPLKEETVEQIYYTEEPECGVNNKSLLEKILDSNSTADDWPWMAVFLQEKNYMNFCGGVLLNRQFILTAAHCFTKIQKEEIVVRLGEYDFTTTNDTEFIDYRISDIIMHPNYSSVTQRNDIALVKLKKPTKYTAFIQPICLPEENIQVHGRVAIVIGWGQTVYGGQLSDILREVAVPIWYFTECKKTYLHRVFDTNICAALYGGGRDSCLGDSGGPLLVQRGDGRWINVGIVSWGINCGQAGKPGVYTLVTSYLKWIIENSRIQKLAK